LDASDCEISSRESVGSAVDAGSGVALGDRAAFSAATIESGRLLGRSGDWEFGRRCQDSRESLEGIAFDGDALTEIFLIRSDSEITRSSSNGAVFSFVGEFVVPANLSISSPTAVSRRDSEAHSGLIWGDKDWKMPLAWATEIRDTVGVFAGEDFVGEIDLARSE
jgi:hypothetical protein